MRSIKTGAVRSFDLALLASNRNIALYRETIYESVWGGMVYYVESEESKDYYGKYGLYPWMDWVDPHTVEWMWLICENYQSEVMGGTNVSNGN